MFSNINCVHLTWRYASASPRSFALWPPQGRDEHHIPYSTHANQWEPLATYVKGQVIEMELFIRFYHKASRLPSTFRLHGAYRC